MRYKPKLLGVQRSDGTTKKRTYKTDKSRKVRVAAYCRVSSDKEEQRMSLDSQIRYYQEQIAACENWDCAGIFSDHGSGLKDEERTALQTLMEKCRQGKIDLILTKSVSRFGRNTLNTLITTRELKALGVDVWFEKERIHLLSQDSEMMLTAYAMFAQAESESMSRNIRAGIRYGFKNGNSGYAHFVCYGYELDSNGKLVINETQAAIVREIFARRAAGQSLAKISDWLYENSIQSPTGKERWSRETLNKILHNEKYTGDVLLQKTYVSDLLEGAQIKNSGERSRYLYQNNHPAIISKELFCRVISFRAK